LNLKSLLWIQEALSLLTPINEALQNSNCFIQVTTYRIRKGLKLSLKKPPVDTRGFAIIGLDK
jgi:hypothetical protein